MSNISLGEWIDQIADRFDAAWQQGPPPRIADFILSNNGTSGRSMGRRAAADANGAASKRNGSAPAATQELGGPAGASPASVLSRVPGGPR